MDARSKKLAACAAVIAACVAVNIALAVIPTAPTDPDEGLPAAPGAVAASEAIADADSSETPKPEPEGDEGATAAQGASLAAGDVPVPEGLPDGADPEAARQAVASCLDRAGIRPAEIKVVDAGESGIDEGRRWWWAYEAALADGSSMRLTLGYAPAEGFYAGVQ